MNKNNKDNINKNKQVKNINYLIILNFNYIRFFISYKI